MGNTGKKTAKTRKKTPTDYRGCQKRYFLKWYSKATVMEDIAREAELSPGTLYLYFKNKDELYPHCLYEYCNI